MNIYNIFAESVKENTIKMKAGRMEIKIGDFETAMIYLSKMQLSEEMRTINYIAPEVLKGVYVKANDVWSIGVILFVMLSGLLPFVRCETFKVANFIGLLFNLL